MLPLWRKESVSVYLHCDMDKSLCDSFMFFAFNEISWETVIKRCIELEFFADMRKKTSLS